MKPSLLISNFTRNTKWKTGFSLVEVVVALGIFAISIVAIIGLLVPVNNSVTDIRDTEDATRLVTNIQGELQKLSFATLKFVLDNPPATDADRLFSSRDGSIVEVGDPVAQTRANVWDPQGVRTQLEEDALKFFKVELLRNTSLSPNSAPNLDANAGYLAYTIKLSWPAFGSNGEAVAASSQSVMLIPAAITR
jgi:uncharacterized protein (TIGR02598 family)